VFIALLFGLSGGATNFFLWYDIKIPPVGNLLVPVYLSLITYAIIKYRFADIKAVIKRSLIFTLLVLLITSVFSASAFIFSTFVQSYLGKNSIILSGVITGIMVAIGFEPIKKVLTKTTDKFLFKGEYDADQFLAKLSNDFSASLNLEKIVETSAVDLADAFRSKGISVYLYDKTVKSFEEKFFYGHHSATITLSKKEIEGYLKLLKPFGLHNVVLVTDELRREEMAKDSEIKALIDRFDKYEVAVTVPLYVQDELIGFYFLEGKKSGDSYTTQDINIMDIMSGQAATAIENALLYEEQKKFAVKLQDEVNKATAELKVANKELKKLDKAKSEFISIASHQLRTPMTVIKGYISMIKDGDFGQTGDKLQKPLESVFQSTNRLLGLIEDLLNISRIESGRMQYDFEVTSFQDIVENVAEEMKQYARQKGLEFEYHGPKEKLPNILIDPKKIREVIMNLADNAIKYTDKGRVDVFLDRKGNELIYRVKDTGRGLVKDDIGKLFKKFSRAGGAQEVHTEGTGLGLYIAKQIVVKHNGKIWAESQGANLGSTFAVSLKIENTKLNELAKDLVKKAVQAEGVVEVSKYKEDSIDMSRIRSKK
jgi:signal transduction histidine kinase